MNGATMAGMEKTEERKAPDYSGALPYTPPAGGIPAVIVDIDGTVAHKTGRGIHDYDRVLEDAPDPRTVRLVNLLSLIEDGQAEIVFVSGRPDRCEAGTRAWLDLHFPELAATGYQLYMRKDGDYRPDYIVKRELFDAHIRGLYDVIAAIDDRLQVVNLWRHMGILCLDVAGGDF
jgi:hypothetical protein